MNVLSLFDGMSCGQIALEKAGIQVNRYYASEVDKYAIKVAKANYPNTLQLGDVTNWKEWDIDWSSIDLLIGGSPCQGFSFAGKQLAFDDPRSKLFFVYVDILNHICEVNPAVKFMLENVRMKKEHLDVISEKLGVDAFFINSGDCSPCVRSRYYWANFPIDYPDSNDVSFLDCINEDSTDNIMSDVWHDWWEKNKEFQLSKKYSAIPSEKDKGICMTARQYASWNGNFIKTKSGKIRKPTKNELCKLSGLSIGYLNSVSQRQSELLTGNGWTVGVIAHIFSELNKGK